MMRSLALALLLGVLTAATAGAQVAAFEKISAVAGVRSLNEGDAFGHALVPLGDLDGNGVPDLAVGVPFNDDGDFDRGSVWILFLDSLGAVEAFQEISSTEGGFTGTLDREDNFGHALAPLGDLDGDDVPELAVSALRDDDGGFNQGAVWILFLRPDGTVKRHQKISATDGGFTGSIQPLNEFGSALAPLGDLDDDGVPDLAVGAALDDDGDGSDRGAVWILFLQPDGTVARHQKISSTAGSFRGMLHGRDLFGTALANLGDLNRDGVPDLAVGAIGDDDGCADLDNDGERDQCDMGAVWVLFLNEQGGVRAQQKISATDGGFTGVLKAGDQLGQAVTPLGDLDGDGVVEMAVGAAFDDDGDPDGGAAWILFLDNGGTVQRHQKISSTDGGFTGILDTDDHFGIALAALGGLGVGGDAETVTALAVGAIGDDDGSADSGAAWILFLDKDGTVVRHQKLSATVGRLSGTLDNADQFGVSVAALGDLDGDANPETVATLAVGAVGDDDGADNSGAVWILFLDKQGRVKTRQKISNTEGDFAGTLDRGDLFGASLASPGDLDGDGVADLAVGAFLDDDGGTSAGAVWILFLDHEGMVKRHQKISATEGGFTGPLRAEDRFGHATASLGDLDGDGVPDLAVGAVTDSDGGADIGAVWILFLRPDGTVKDQQKISATQGGFTGLLSPGDGFGAGLAALGDLDGDGVPDLAVGANLDEDEGGTANTGSAWILFLQPDGTVKQHQKISTTEGGFTGVLDQDDGFGRSLAPLYNLSSLTDLEAVIGLAIGASQDDDEGFDKGAVWILFLRPDGTVVHHQKISATEGNFRGVLNDADRFGIALANLGDLNNDKVPDLAVGADLSDDGGVDRGATWILFANTAPFITNPAARQEETPDLPIHLGPPILLSAEIRDNLGVAGADLHFRRAGVASFLTSPMLPVAEGTTVFEATLPEFFADGRGIEYFITARDEHGFSTRLPEAGIISLQIGVPGIIVMPQAAGIEENAYQLIAVPLLLEEMQASAVLEDDLGTYDNTQWRLFDPSGAEFPDVLPMVPGATFWLIVKETELLVDTGPGISVPTDAPFAVALEAGWTYFGHPFFFNVPLFNVATRSGQPLDIWAYEGAWKQLQPDTPDADTLKLFQGYAVFNDNAEPDVLLIDPDLTAAASGVLAAEHAALPASSLRWSIRILAQSGPARDVETVAAVAADAAVGWDRLDRAEPPGFGDYVSVYFVHPEWRKNTTRYSRDARPAPAAGGAVWPFEVTTTVRDHVLLTFDGLDGVPPEYDVWLVDDVVQTAQNLRETPSYTVAATTDPRALKLVVGTPGFLDGELAESREIPTRFELFPNFPNPFNPSTTLRYGLPEASPVSLVVYNMLGRKVATLAGGARQEAGYHAVVWDGRSDAGAPVASGVYFARMQAGRFVQTQTMILVR